MTRPSRLSLERVPGRRLFGGFSRRVRALIVAAVLFVVLFALALTLPVPYVVLSPGPTCNTLTTCYNQTVVGISGIATNSTSGHLNLTTVGVSEGSVTPLQAISGWLSSDRVVVPRSAVYPPGQSEQQTNQQNTEQFVGSQDSAVAAAGCELGYPKGFGVVQLTSHSASKGKLQPGDFIETVDGRPANTAKTLTAILATKPAGTTVSVGIKRQGSAVGDPLTARTEDVTLGTPPKGHQGGLLGVEVASGCLVPFTVDLGLANEIGGPSAGTMFALGIIDKVGPNDLTGGRFIAGTGTIDAAGNIGPIGGITLKMIAARRKGASVFLAPAGNCSDVRGATPAGLHVVKVSTLHQAVQDLLALKQGRSVPGC